jgi:CheY-like chemotaxis protein
MDIRMPEMNGHEATQQIRNFNKNVIIIAQTSYGFSEDKEKAIEAGCNDLITKPINQGILDKLIEKQYLQVISGKILKEFYYKHQLSGPVPFILIQVR